MSKKRKGRAKMKKRATFTIDEDVYQYLKDVPRGVSVSEIVSFVLKAMFQDLKKGKELSQKEFDEWIESTPEGRDFRERFIEEYGEYFEKLRPFLNLIDKNVKKKPKKK